MSRGAANSRMKDFHDILLLCRKDDLVNIEKLKQSIQATFRNRDTEITTPLFFSEDERIRLQAYWIEHLRTLGNEMRKVLNLPSEISEVIDELNAWLDRL